MHYLFVRTPFDYDKENMAKDYGKEDMLIIITPGY